MNNKLNSWWNPDLRPENIEDYEETYTFTNDTGGEQTQTETYKFIKLPIIINKVLSKVAFIWTHAGCVWYNRLANRTVKDELDALNAKMEGVKFIKEHFISPPSGVSVGASSYTNHVVDVSKEGYVPIALVNIWSGNSSIVLYGNTLDPLTGRAVIGLKNTSTSSQAGVVQYSVLYEVAE